MTWAPNYSASRYPASFSHPWASLYRDGRVANMRAYVGGLAPYVGATGDEWGQGGGEWEGGGDPTPGPSSPGGPTATQIATLQVNVAALKNQVDGVVGYMDPDTDPASKQAVLALQANVNALSSSVAALSAGTQNTFVNYPVLLIKYNAYKNELDGYGLEVVTDPAPADPAQGKPAATPKTTTPVKPPASPDAPVILTKDPATASTNYLPWGLLGGALVLGLAALYFVRKAL